MSYNIGLNVIEVDGAGAPAIAGAATSVAAFNVLTRRGIPNRPARIAGFAEFVERFGGHFPAGLGSYLVKGFFDNEGGIAYVNRVVKTGASPSTAASRELVDATPNPTLKVEAGWRGAADPGSWGRSLHVRTTRRSVTTGLRLQETAPATVTTPAPLPATIDMSTAGFPPLVVTIDGATAPISIPFIASNFAIATAATPVEIMNAVNNATNDLDATLDATGELRLTSTGNVALMSGGFTSLAVVANTTLGFPAAISDAGNTAPLLATGSTLHSVSGIKVGDAILFDDGSPPAEAAKVVSINPLTRAVTWAPGISVANYDVAALRISTLEFDLEVFDGGTDVDDHRVEVWTGLSMEPDVANHAVEVLNHPATGSRFIRATDLASASAIGANRPADLAVPLALDTGGVDGVPTSGDFIGDAAARTGFNAFDTFDVQMVTCERTDAAIAQAGITYCEGRGDCLYVGAVPEGAMAAGTALAYGQALMGAKRYGALYGPWVLVADPIGIGDAPTKLIPPVGHVMGVFARVERVRGIWKAPAGDQATLRNVLDVPYRLSDAEHSNLVRQASVNGIRALPRAGVVIDASRTLSSDPRWAYVNVRLLFNFVKSSLRQGLGWVRQEPNRDQLWSLVSYGSVRPFLMRLWRQGAFGTGKPSEVFTIVCDASNNPPDQVQLGFLNVEIYFYPSVPAETIVIKVGQQPSGAKVSES